MTSARWTPAYVGAGSNLDDPAAQIAAGLAAIDAIPDTRRVLTSSLYRSAPMGPSDQPDYVNAATVLLTKLAPAELLARLHAIEDRHGRRRERHWGPRTLDLDLLAQGGETSDTEQLRLPHPGVASRDFVLAPLAEIAPLAQLPGLGEIRGLLAQLESCEAIRL